jgi:two-component system OmpR family sensor kinase
VKWQKWALAAVPLAAGLVVVSLTAFVPTVPNPILSLRIDLGTLALILGFVLSALVALGLVLWQRAEYRGAQRETSARTVAAEERRRFLQRLDHEMKNPLTAIRAGLANLASGSLSTVQEEALASTEAQVLRLSRLTSDLRKLAELETRPLERDAVDVAQLLQETVALAEELPESGERQLSLTLPQAPWPVPEVQGDWDLLFLAIFNLLDNALKFTLPGDTVEVRAFEYRAFVVVEVADTGPGISRDELPQVWEELYRGEGARGIPGSGLGLALSRAIVERHEGEVRLQSRAGQGTVVTVRLPVSSNS